MLGNEREHQQPNAHAARDPQGEWRKPHDLTEHLQCVAKRAAEFAQGFGSDWVELASRWHDLGKYRPRFQKYIRLASGFEGDAHIENKPRRAYCRYHQRPILQRDRYRRGDPHHAGFRRTACAGQRWAMPRMFTKRNLPAGIFGRKAAL